MTEAQAQPCQIDEEPAFAASAVVPSDLVSAPAPESLARDEVFQRIDELEVEMMAHPAVECPVDHLFTPGLYSRQITMPAGALITSKIHRTEHPYVVSKGKVSVYTQDRGWVTITAPFRGVTKPGTRRVLYIHEDTVWTTFHVTQRTTVEDIEADIIEPRNAHRAGMVQPEYETLPAELPQAEGDLPCPGLQ